MPLRVFRVGAPNPAVPVLPQPCPRLRPRIVPFTEQVVHAHDARNQHLGEVATPVLVEAVTIGQRREPLDCRGGIGVRRERDEAVRCMARSHRREPGPALSQSMKAHGSLPSTRFHGARS